MMIRHLVGQPRLAKRLGCTGLLDDQLTLDMQGSDEVLAVQKEPWLQSSLEHLIWMV